MGHLYESHVQLWRKNQLPYLALNIHLKSKEPAAAYFSFLSHSVIVSQSV